MILSRIVRKNCQKGTEEYPCKRVQGVLRWKVNNREIFCEVYDPSRVTQLDIINKFKLIGNALPGRKVTLKREIAHSVKWEKTEEYDLKELEQLEQLEELKEVEESESESSDSEVEGSQRLKEQEQLDGWELLNDVKQPGEPKEHEQLKKPEQLEEL